MGNDSEILRINQRNEPCALPDELLPMLRYPSLDSIHQQQKEKPAQPNTRHEQALPGALNDGTKPNKDRKSQQQMPRQPHVRIKRASVISKADQHYCPSVNAVANAHGTPGHN